METPYGELLNEPKEPDKRAMHLVVGKHYLFCGVEVRYMGEDLYRHGTATSKICFIGSINSLPSYIKEYLSTKIKGETTFVPPWGLDELKKVEVHEPKPQVETFSCPSDLPGEQHTGIFSRFLSAIKNFLGQ